MTRDVTEEKTVLRGKAAEQRRVAHGKDKNGDAARAVMANVLTKLPIASNAVVGGYWPIGTELDVRPLLTALHERGHVCGLPVAHRGQALAFHRWRPNDRLVRGRFDIQVPDQNTPSVDPDVLLVPMLAFDSSGMRIGYGLL